MNWKKTWGVILVIVAFIIIKNYHAIIHLCSGGQDALFATPHAFHFKIITSTDKGDVFEEYDAEYDKGKDIYYYRVPAKYLNNDDVQVYATGYLWNCLAKPHIKVNGVTLDDISLSNTGSDVVGWSDKLYHFYYNDTIYSNTEYKFYIRCHDYSDSSTVVFLPE